jgi:hypothetical protein
MHQSLSGPGREVTVIETDLAKPADRDRLAARADAFAIDS